MPTATDTLTVRQWAVAVLDRLGVPVTESNIRFMVAWAAAEGGQWHNPDHYNPLGTTKPQPGSHPTNSVGVQSYTSWDSGIAATVSMLNQKNMSGIKAALATGQGGAAAVTAVAHSPWGTKHIDLATGTTYNPAGGPAGSFTGRPGYTSQGFGPYDDPAAGKAAPPTGSQTSSPVDQLNAAKVNVANDWITALDQAMTPSYGWNPLKDTGETLKFVAVRGGFILLGLTVVGAGLLLMFGRDIFGAAIAASPAGRVAAGAEGAAGLAEAAAVAA